MRLRPHVAIALIAQLVSAESGAGAGLPAAATDSWQRLETRSLVVYTNADAAAGARVSRTLERVVDAFASTTSGLIEPNQAPTVVMLFRDRASFAPYRPRHEGRSEDVAGYFIPGPDVGYMAMTAPSGPEPMRVAIHELVHAITRASIPDLPLWLQEGLAEFYSTLRVGARDADIGRAIPEHLQWLSAYAPTPLDQLLAIDATSPDYHEGARQGTFYAQSWAFTHYLCFGIGEHGAGLGKMLTAIRRGRTATRALREAYAVQSPSDLQPGFAEYLKRQQYVYRHITFTEDFDQVEVRARAAERFEVLLRLGSLMLNVSPADSRAHLEAALTIDPQNARALATLGLAHSASGDAARAHDAFTRAMASRPTDAWPWFIAGRERLHERLERGGVPIYWGNDSTPAEVLEARSLLEQALERAPDDAEIKAEYAKTFLFGASDYYPGLSASMDAAEALPAREDVLVDLILLQAAAGQPSVARKTLALLGGRASAEQLRMAALAIAHAEIRQADRLVKEDRPADADSVLRRGVEQAAHSEARRSLAERLEYHRSMTANRAAVELINRAEVAVINRRSAEATQLLEEAGRTATDPELKRHVETRLQELRDPKAAKRP